MKLDGRIMEKLVTIRISTLDEHMLDATGEGRLGGAQRGERYEYECSEECEGVFHGCAVIHCLGADGSCLSQARLKT
jgi:hypothetical protein